MERRTGKAPREVAGRRGVGYEGARRLSAIVSSGMVSAAAPGRRGAWEGGQDRDRWRSTVERLTRRKGGSLHFERDASLSVFDSAVAAVESALDLRHELLEEPRIWVRTGIHTGDMLFDRGRVRGDAIDVAVQLQRMGSPGSVLASGKVYDEIKNQPHLSAAALGDFRLAGVPWPVRVFTLGGEVVPGSRASALVLRSALETKWSIAVMPFVSLGTNPEDAMFGDGLTAELTSLLTRVDGVLVAASTSAFAHRNGGEDVRSLAAGLGVRMLLVGGVSTDGDRVHVTAQLIDAASGDVRLSESYDRQVEGLFETQEDLARQIVEAVRRHRRRDHA